MKSDDLTTAQAAEMRDRLNGLRQYVNLMANRMALRRFPPNDPLYVDTLKTKDALQSLWMRLHYLSCSHGVGAPERK